MFQGMYELPDQVNNRFKLYLNILPVAQDVAIYFSFIGGAIALLWSIVKILLHQPKGPTGLQWSETEMQKQRLHFFNEKEPTAKSKEMEVYYNSLLSTQTEEMTSVAIEDLPIIKENVA